MNLLTTRELNRGLSRLELDENLEKIEEFAKETSESIENINAVPENITFDDDGHIELNGSATVYDDLTADITRSKTVGTRVTINDIEATIEFTTLSSLSDYAVLSYQLRHAWKIGSTIKPHVHYEQTSSASPNILIQYRWQMQGEAKSTAWTNLSLPNNAFTYTSGTLNQIKTGASIVAPAQSSLSDIIQLRVIRDNANASGLFAGADTYAGVLSITACDIHIELDSMGSGDEYTK